MTSQIRSHIEYLHVGYYKRIIFCAHFEIKIDEKAILTDALTMIFDSGSLFGPPCM